jgi:type IV pilus secretin PilQ/predicted competence protein
VRWSVLLCTLTMASAGCTRSVVVSQDTATAASSPVDTTGTGDVAAGALRDPSTGGTQPSGFDLREIKVLDDNGQAGVFVKLSQPPASVRQYSLTQPNRIVVDITGLRPGEQPNAQRFTVDNRLISEIRLARNDDRLRLTLLLRVDPVPAYTVNDLNDTVVAFVGEPVGANEPVREQVVFSKRAPAPGPVASGDPASAPRQATRSEQQSASPLGRSVDGATTRRAPYHGQRVSLDFKDADISNVLRLLAEVSQLNIIATDDVRGKVTIRLFEVPWDQALDIILQVLNLESIQDGNVIRVSTVKRLREEREELQRAQEALRSVEPLHVDYIHVNYAKAAKLSEIISGTARTRRGQAVTGPRIEEEEGVLTRRGTVMVDEFTNTLIVRDIQRGIDNARDVVRKLDVQTPQIMIESAIIEATSDFASELGVQWGYRSVYGPETGNPTGVNFPGSVGVGGSGLNVGPGNIPFIADFPAATAIAGGGSALGLVLGSVDGSQALAVRISALEKQGKARVISKPRVATLNNVAATIKSLTILRVKLPSTGTVINTGAGGAAGTASTATERIETGIILVVTPQVSADGFVLLDIFAKSSQADFTHTVDGIPTEIAREANSHVLVKDGQTVVLGGIYRDTTSDNVSGTPYLKDIPGLGWLFRTKSKEDRREDLLVFMTPRIMGGGGTELPTADVLWQHRGTGYVQ